MNFIIKKIERAFPDLGAKLKQARIYKPEQQFVREILVVAGMVSMILTLILFLFMPSLHFLVYVLAFIALAFLSFIYFIQIPAVSIKNQDRLINEEIIFAGRFLIIEVESGMDTYDAMLNLSRNFDSVGKYFREIVENIDLGVSMETALEKGIVECPSDNLRQVLYQILNSLRSGSNIADAISHIIDKISREQHIDIKLFGSKLNPIAMFYLVAAVIFPSIGLTILVIVESFIELNLNLWFFFGITALVLIVQIIFLFVIKAVRPAIHY